MNTLHADLMSVLEWAVAQKLRAVCEDHGIVVFDVV